MAPLNFGISTDDFRSTIFEKEAAIFRGACANAFNPPLDIASALTYGSHKDGRVNMFLDGPLPFNLFTETYQDVTEVGRRVVLQQVEQLLEQGATLSINRIDRLDPQVRDICRQIQSFTQEIATANCYAATSGNGTFGRHWDTHDVIALQLTGRKRWKVWKPTYHLPTPGQVSRPHRPLTTPNPDIDIVIEAGDALYLPRGWWHEATPISGHSTIHLAVGLHASTLADYIGWLATELLPKHAPLRQSFESIVHDEVNLTEALESFHRAAQEKPYIKSYSQLHKKVLATPSSSFESAF